jgi:hypothetical protein
MPDLLTQCCNAYAGETGDPCDRDAMAAALRRIAEVILGLPTTPDGRAVALLLLQAARVPEQIEDDDEPLDYRDEPSLTAAERNPSLNP